MYTSLSALTGGRGVVFSGRSLISYTESGMKRLAWAMLVVAAAACSGGQAGAGAANQEQGGAAAAADTTQATHDSTMMMGDTAKKDTVKK